MLLAGHADMVGHGLGRGFRVAIANGIDDALVFAAGVLGAALATGVRRFGNLDDVGRQNADEGVQQDVPRGLGDAKVEQHRVFVHARRSVGDDVAVRRMGLGNGRNRFGGGTFRGQRRRLDFKDIADFVKNDVVRLALDSEDVLDEPVECPNTDPLVPRFRSADGS